MNITTLLYYEIKRLQKTGSYCTTSLESHLKTENKHEISGSHTSEYEV
jgi:hypothetical protein